MYRMPSLTHSYRISARMQKVAKFLFQIIHNMTLASCTHVLTMMMAISIKKALTFCKLNFFISSWTFLQLIPYRHNNMKESMMKNKIAWTSSSLIKFFSILETHTHNTAEQNIRRTLPISFVQLHHHDDQNKRQSQSNR